MTNIEKIEIKIYKFLGIEKFKRLVFKLENFIHRNDNMKNINYHVINSNSISSVENFKKYLYNNGKIHVRSLINGVIIIGITLILGINPLILTFLGLLMIKDIYCIMLQRFNWIKIKEFQRKLKEKEERKIIKEKESLDYEQVKQTATKLNINRKEMIEELWKIRAFIENELMTIEELKTECIKVNPMLNETYEEYDETLSNESVIKLKRVEK